MRNASMHVFWMVTMVLGLAAGMWSMTLLASLSSNHLYSQAIDGAVTVATINQITNSGVQIANANAAALTAVNGGREVPVVNLTTINAAQPLTQPQPQPQPQPDNGWTIEGMVWGLLKFAGWMALTAVVVYIFKVAF